MIMLKVFVYDTNETLLPPRVQMAKADCVIKDGVVVKSRYWPKLLGKKITYESVEPRAE